MYNESSPCRKRALNYGLYEGIFVLPWNILLFKLRLMRQRRLYGVVAAGSAIGPLERFRGRHVIWTPLQQARGGS